MATVVYSVAASLDGFITGPGGDMSWLAEHVGQDNPAGTELLARTGAILCGARTFHGDDPGAGTENEGAFGGGYDGPLFLLTHHPPADPGPGVTVVTDLHDGLASAAAAAGERCVTVLGADVARQLLRAGLLDEVVVVPVPVLLGDGVRVFDVPGGLHVRLEPVPGAPGPWFRVVT